MKTALLLLSILFSLVSCDPYNFGFKHNPAWVLENAYHAMMNEDFESFNDVSGKEALCIYGNADGMHYLKENVLSDVRKLKLEPKLLEKRHMKVPEFADFWSYYFERYQVSVVDKHSGKIAMETIVDCNYGTGEDRDEYYENLSPRRYPRKECRLVKIIPRQFKALRLQSRCDSLKVTSSII